MKDELWFSCPGRWFPHNEVESARPLMGKWKRARLLWWSRSNPPSTAITLFCKEMFNYFAFCNFLTMRWKFILVSVDQISNLMPRVYLRFKSCTHLGSQCGARSNMQSTSYGTWMGSPRDMIKIRFKRREAEIIDAYTRGLKPGLRPPISPAWSQPIQLATWDWQGNAQCAPLFVFADTLEYFWIL